MGFHRDEDIDRCLNCKWPECVNCLAGGKGGAHTITKIGCYDPRTGKFIIAFDTVALASQATNITKGNIRQALRGTNKTAGGYIWKPITEEE